MHYHLQSTYAKIDSIRKYDLERVEGHSPIALKHIDKRLVIAKTRYDNADDELQSYDGRVIAFSHNLRVERQAI
jgi:hypothetical protein